ncbi:MAG: L,D-transpeptidase family protein [Solirubrobacteraceae bacterium]
MSRSRQAATVVTGGAHGRPGWRAGRKRPLRSLRLVGVLLAASLGGLLLWAGTSALSSTGPSLRDRSAATSFHNPPRTLRIVGISPSNGATGVSDTGRVAVTFSAPISASSPMPRFNPALVGSWRVVGRKATFIATAPLIPLSELTLTIPGGIGGVKSTDGAVLGRTVAENFTIRGGSTLRLQQLLSILGYSPLSWSPTGAPIAPGDTNAQIAAMYAPPEGNFTWQSHAWPASLQSLWQEGSYNVFTRGMVMAFQAAHALLLTGRPTAGLWNDLLGAIHTDAVNPNGYTYAVGSKSSPEQLTVWHNGAIVLQSLANTGIPQTPTPTGTFTVYARYRRQIMHGKNPDGVAYADPVQYVAYFHDGDAVHYFPRASYGFPQSLGCIELPLTSAAVAWPYLTYGTLVTVVN